MVRAERTPKHPAVTLMVAMVQGDPSLNATDLSPRVGLSVSRLARLFKREMGVSLVDYRNELRLERFFQFVEQGGGRPSSLGAVARAVGFRSYGHFHRLFRDRWRLGPREFLQKMSAPGR
jgi:transcriptional regulator GlxA family with amidase domain